MSGGKEVSRVDSGGSWGYQRCSQVPPVSHLSGVGGYWSDGPREGKAALGRPHLEALRRCQGRAGSLADPAWAVAT